MSVRHSVTINFVVQNPLITGFPFPQHKPNFWNRQKAKLAVHSSKVSLKLSKLKTPDQAQITCKSIWKLFVPSHRKNNYPLAHAKNKKFFQDVMQTHTFTLLKNSGQNCLKLTEHVIAQSLYLHVNLFEQLLLFVDLYSLCLVCSHFYAPSFYEIFSNC